MNITKKDVEYVAALARLEISEEEKEKYTGQLNMILEYVSRLNELDTEGVMPSYNLAPAADALREDTVKPSLEREKVLMNAPDKQDGCFKVPRIID